MPCHLNQKEGTRRNVKKKITLNKSKQGIMSQIKEINETFCGKNELNLL